jgi:hypothetical protein
MGLDTPKLIVPKEFATTKEGRGWIINPFGRKNPIFMWFAALLPALLATILIFMDQQITAVITNRKENKLKVKEISKFSIEFSSSSTYNRKVVVIISIY